MDLNDVRAAFVAAGLERVVQDIAYLARPSIRLLARPIAEAAQELGASRLGGLPDLPADLAWPQWRGLPQSFIAQIRLADLRPWDREQLLPTEGMLWFFYDARQEVFGESLADRGGWLVHFAKTETGALSRASTPATLPASAHFHPCALSFRGEITLSLQPQLDVPQCRWTEEELRRYERLLASFPDPAEHAAVHHRMLGYPETLQDDMRLQCQLVTHGVSSINDPQAAGLVAGASDWQLLLQVDSDEQAGMRWASAGMLYYWIHREDLLTSHFDATWLVVQSD